MVEGINNKMAGKILKTFRLANLMTIEQFASYIGISAIYLGSLERGIRSVISDKYLDAILDNLNVSREFFDNLMTTGNTLESILTLHVDLSEEAKERFLFQELSFLILNHYHEQTLKVGFIEKKKNKY